MSFRDLGLSEPLVRAVASQGYTVPTPIQSAAIPLLIAGRDLLGNAQTGTGKTAAFALPILQRLMSNDSSQQNRRPVIRVLVLAPTRELACQIGDSFRAYGRHTGLRHTTIFGGVGQGQQVRTLRHGVDILVATPGRLLDLEDQGFVDLSRVEILVLDEADRLLDMGFLPDLRRIVAKVPAQRQTLLLSATMPQGVLGLANSLLRDPARVDVPHVKETTELIVQSVQFVQAQDKPEALSTFLTTRPVERALVFTRTKHGADRLVRHLTESGIRAEAIHGNKSQAKRQRALSNFKTSRPPVLVATDIAARGIDVERVSHVFNFDLPHEPETYVHRIGRTGRAGAAGIAVAFCDRAERNLLRAIERLIRKPLEVDGPQPGTDKPSDPSPHQFRPSNGGPGPNGPRRKGRVRRPPQPRFQAKHPQSGGYRGNRRSRVAS